MKKDYNVVVIGAGSGGLVSAYICAVLKAKVALIEKNKMGGDCLNTGCVPSKALLRTASILSQIKRHRDFGLKSASAEFDFSTVMERVQRIIKKIEPHDSVERYTKMGVECIQGEAEILSPYEVRVGKRVLTTKNIIVATGASPTIPKIEGLSNTGFFTTETIWNLREQPKRLAVIGGGPIGSELSQAFARLGTQVTQIHRGPQLLHREDAVIAKIMEKRFLAEGVALRLKTTPTSVRLDGSNKVLVLRGTEGTSELNFDQLLVAVGRKPRVEGFGLEKLGIELDSKGRIKADAYSRTNIKNIFACGDVTSPYQFTHMASHQAWYCAVNALFKPFKKFKIAWSTIPWVTYTDPEIARVGLNEKEAKAKGVSYELAEYRLDDLDRAITEGEDHGLVRVLTVPGKDKILGATLCGYHAGDLLPEFVTAMKHRLGLGSILSTIHAYPTMSEANKYAAGVWKKTHAPQNLLRMIEKFHAFRR